MLFYWRIMKKRCIDVVDFLAQCECLSVQSRPFLTELAKSRVKHELLDMQSSLAPDILCTI